MPHWCEAMTDRIPIGELAYMRTRNRRRLYSLVMAEFQRSGLSKEDLAQRLGVPTTIVGSWLATPGYWNIDTFSDLLFAISGAEATYTLNYPAKVRGDDSS